MKLAFFLALIVVAAVALAVWSVLSYVHRQITFPRPYLRRISAGRAALKNGDFGESESQFLSAIDEAKKIAERDLVLASDLGDLASAYKGQGQHAQAKRIQMQAVSIFEKARKPDHVDLAKPLHDLAELYRLLGQYEEAEPLYQRTLTIWEKASRYKDADFAAGLENHARFLRETNRNDEAAELEARAAAIRTGEADR